MHLILLAAGSSRRFGENKLRWNYLGKPLYRHVLDHLLEIQRERGWDVTVVTREDSIYPELLKLPVRVVLNPDYELGISTSLRCGLSAISGDGKAAAFFVADQPMLRKESILGLLDGFIASKMPLACVCWGERSGNPCVFSPTYFDSLRALTGDQGGKRILQQNMDQCFLYSVADEAELMDYDRKPE